jgi:hypothetical protein
VFYKPERSGQDYHVRSRPPQTPGDALATEALPAIVPTDQDATALAA